MRRVASRLKCGTSVEEEDVGPEGPKPPPGLELGLWLLLVWELSAEEDEDEEGSGRGERRGAPCA